MQGRLRFLLRLLGASFAKGQARDVSMLIRPLAEIFPVAICLGNHGAGGPRVASRSLVSDVNDPRY